MPNAGLYVAGGIAEAGCAPSLGFAIWYGVGPAAGAPMNVKAQVFVPILQR